MRLQHGQARTALRVDACALLVSLRETRKPTRPIALLAEEE